jgi:hypothetical protein
MELEWAGRPTAAIIADALVGSAEQMKRVSAMKDYEYVVTPYPVGSLSPDEVEERAARIADGVVKLVFLPDGKP